MRKLNRRWKIRQTKVGGENTEHCWHLTDLNKNDHREEGLEKKNKKGKIVGQKNKIEKNSYFDYVE